MRAVVLSILALTLAASADAAKGNRYPAGCLRQADVAIGYYPRTVAESIDLLVAPQADALVRHALVPGQRFAVQSVPNPDHLTDPGVPATTNGYLWGYAKRGGRSGWVRADALGPDRSEDPWAFGPAGADFQAIVDGPDDDVVPRFTLGRRVTGTRTVVDHTVYQRWAPNSSPRALLVRGDAVQLLWRSGAHYCVSVNGRRGWIPRSSVV